MRKLLKVRIDADGVLVKYQEAKGENAKTETVTLEAEDPPLPELERALSSMAEHLCAICELPADWVEDIEVRSVTVTYTEAATGLVITGLRSLDGSSAPLILNSPHFTDAPYSETDQGGKGIYSADCGRDLNELARAAFAYVDGKRGQLQLDLRPREAEATPA